MLLPVVALLAAGAASVPAEPPLDQVALRSHMAYLADDALQGRAPGTEGGNKAAAYIARQLQLAGVKPGGADGSWYQPVGLVQRIPASFTQSWVTKERSIALDAAQSQFVSRDGTDAVRQGDVIFAGYGLDLPDIGYHDLADVDVRDKIVLLLSGRPKAAPNAPGLEVRRRAIAQAGATAVIALSGQDDPWQLIRDQLGRGRTGPAEEAAAPIEGALSYPAWTSLLGESGVNLARLLRSAREPGFKARALQLKADIVATSSVRQYRSYNVIGRIAGQGVRDQAVMFMAHWDHLGVCRPEGVADRICNGAVDNASGVAMMIEIARRFSHGPATDRSLYFVSTTAEEMGLLGAQALADHPPVPLDKIAAVLNLDTVAVAPAGEPIAVIGRGLTPLDPSIDRAAEMQGRKVDTSDAVNAFINRQDGWVFIKAGIPAAMIGGAFADPALLAAFLASDYHQPGDDLSRKIPFDGMAEDGAFHVVLARMLADPTVFPVARRKPR
jgi:hypothetical protein